LRERFQQVRSDDEASELSVHWAGPLWYFDEDEATAWWDAGIGPHDYVAAGTLKLAGLKPDHLGLVIDGRRVGAMIRGGVAASQIVGLLRQRGILS